MSIVSKMYAEMDAVNNTATGFPFTSLDNTENTKVQQDFLFSEETQDCPSFANCATRRFSDLQIAIPATDGDKMNVVTTPKITLCNSPLWISPCNQQNVASSEETKDCVLPLRNRAYLFFHQRYQQQMVSAMMKKRQLFQTLPQRFYYLRFLYRTIGRIHKPEYLLLLAFLKH